MLYHVTIGSRTFAVDLTGDRITVDGEAVGDAELVALPGTPVRHLLLDGQSTTVVARRGGEGWAHAQPEERGAREGDRAPRQGAAGLPVFQHR